ncbi:Nudix hydrolase 13 mitochondrial [Zea mays]|uniref:Nudix hydrolase 13 mitochondrial n=1 Tax=Zea mays TaxID=4577 RepID=A0A1D6Q2F2_MAIZE|nr:Nudix hydrolase 13 mitochondrial [Zea mays]
MVDDAAVANCPNCTLHVQFKASATNSDPLSNCSFSPFGFQLVMSLHSSVCLQLMQHWCWLASFRGQDKATVPSALA